MGCLPCQQHRVLALSIVAHEVAKAGLWNLQGLIGILKSRQPGYLVDVGITLLSADVVLRILVGPLDIPCDIKRVPGSPTQLCHQ